MQKKENQLKRNIRDLKANVSDSKMGLVSAILSGLGAGYMLATKDYELSGILGAISLVSGYFAYNSNQNANEVSKKIGQLEQELKGFI